MSQVRSRRNFLVSTPMAAAMGFSITSAARSLDSAQSPVPFRLLSAEELNADKQALHAHSGDKTLFEASALPLRMVLTTEASKSAKEFEWHEGRDHVFCILEGATTYELGGKPKDGHSPKPGEWLAPASEDAQMVQLKQGDVLVVPRGTPHRRTTQHGVTFMLLSSE